MQICVEPVWLCWIEAHDGLAAWFQAVFSILAIAAAILIPLIIASAEVSRHHKRLHLATYVVARHALAALELVRDKMRVPANNGSSRLEAIPPAAIDISIDELQSLPINTIDDLELSQNVRFLKMTLRDVSVNLRRLEGVEEANIGPDVPEFFARAASTGRREFDEIVKACTTLPRHLRRRPGQ